MPRPKKVPSFSAALDCRDLELVKQYIDKNPKIVNAYIPSSRGYGTNPLRKVVTNEDIELIKLLLSYPTIDVNRTYVYTYFDDDITETALFAALETGNVEIVSLLLNHPDINVNYVRTFGETPLHIAMRKWEMTIANLLLARPDLNPNLGRPLFNEMMKDGKVERASLLLNHPNMNFCARQGALNPGRWETIVPSAFETVVQNTVVQQRCDPILLDQILQSPRLTIDLNNPAITLTLSMLVKCHRFDIIQQILSHPTSFEQKHVNVADKALWFPFLAPNLPSSSIEDSTQEFQAQLFDFLLSDQRYIKSLFTLRTQVTKYGPDYLRQSFCKLSKAVFVEVYEILLHHSLNRDVICTVFHFLFDTRYPTSNNCNNDLSVEVNRFNITSVESLVDFLAIESELGNHPPSRK